MMSSQSTDTIHSFDQKRVSLGIPLHQLLLEAHVSRPTWYRVRSGEVTPQRRTLVKLSRALDRLAGAPVEEEPALPMVAAFWRAAVWFLAHELGADPARALDDAGQSCPQDPDWLKASRARQLAFYLAHTELSVSHSTLAAAVGTSKQRVHKAVMRVEDLRDELDLDALLDRASATLAGRLPPKEPSHA